MRATNLPATYDRATSTELKDVEPNDPPPVDPYHITGDNHQIIDGLEALPPSKFNYAADVLCVAVGCDVRLITLQL